MTPPIDEYLDWLNTAIEVACDDIDQLEAKRQALTEARNVYEDKKAKSKGFNIC